MAFPVADPYAQAVRSGFAVTYTVDASRGGSPVAGAQGLRPTGGSVSDTTKPGVRRSLSLELPGDPAMYDLLLPSGTTLTCTAHVRYTSRFTADIPMGLFDVDSESFTEGGGSLSLTAPDKWVRIQRARFMGPAASTRGITVTAQIVALIRGALGASEPVTVTASSTATMTAVVWDKDRAQAIIDLATSIGAWVHFDRYGVATVADIPTIGARANWLVDASSTGILTDLDRQRSRTDTRNVVVVSSSADKGPRFPTQYVWDNDPASPTYAGPGTGSGTTPPSATTAGPFGIVPYFYDSPILANASAAIAAGRTILARTTGLASQVTLSQVPNPAADAFDTLDVLPPGQTTYRLGSPARLLTRGGRTVERHVADTLTHPLTASSPLHIEGRSTRSDIYVGS
ncbi:MAG: hypothetical protein JWO98_4742 [Frankiales bacterium]|nr:hypothetical protein [Frankiales bacterium]